MAHPRLTASELTIAPDRSDTMISVNGEGAVFIDWDVVSRYAERPSWDHSGAVARIALAVRDGTWAPIGDKC